MKQIDERFRSSFDVFKDFGRDIEMSAIWLGEAMNLSDGTKTKRVEPGMVITVEDQNYEVLQCRGTLLSTNLYFVLKNNITGEKSKYPVK